MTLDMTCIIIFNVLLTGNMKRHDVIAWLISMAFIIGLLGAMWGWGKLSRLIVVFISVQKWLTLNQKYN